MTKDSFGNWAKVICLYMGIPVVLAALTFWAIFFKFTPWLIGYLGETPHWAHVLVYCGVAYFGGAAVPLIVLILGLVIAFRNV